jgi:hypothetical protein
VLADTEMSIVCPLEYGVPEVIEPVVLRDTGPPLFRVAALAGAENAKARGRAAARPAVTAVRTCLVTLRMGMYSFDQDLERSYRGEVVGVFELGLRPVLSSRIFIPPASEQRQRPTTRTNSL